MLVWTLVELRLVYLEFLHLLFQCFYLFFRPFCFDLLQLEVMRAVARAAVVEALYLVGIVAYLASLALLTGACMAD